MVLSPPANPEKEIAKMPLQVHILSDTIHFNGKR